MMTHPNRLATMIPRLAFAAILAVMVFHVDPLHAAMLLVDFQNTTNGVTETTPTVFQSFARGNGNDWTNTYGDLSVSVTNVVGYFSRTRTINDNPPDFTYNDLYRDYFYRNDSDQAVITLSGLTPFQQYRVQLFAFDPGDNGNLSNQQTLGDQLVTFAPDTGNGTMGDAGTVLYDGAVLPTEDDQYSATVFFRANALGELGILASAVRQVQLDDTSTLDRLRVNGFILTLPEPASLTLMVVGLTLVYRRRPKACISRRK